MGGGRQSHNRSRPQVARNNTLTPHHHHAHVRFGPRSLSKIPDYRKGGDQRLKARHEIWAATNNVQLNKEKEELENSPVAKLLLDEPSPPKCVDFWLLRPKRVYRPVSSWYKNSVWGDLIESTLTYKQLYISTIDWNIPSRLMETETYPLIKLDSSGFDDSSSEQWSDAMDELVDDDSVDPTP